MPTMNKQFSYVKSINYRIFQLVERGRKPQIRKNVHRQYEYYIKFYHYSYIDKQRHG